MKKKILLVPLAMLLAMSLVVAGYPAPASTQPIKIGVLSSQTGINAHPTLSDSIEVALQLYPQVAGRPIQIIHLDDASDVKTGLERAKRLVEIEKVNFLIGPRFNPVYMAVMEYTRQLPLVHMGLVSDLSYAETKEKYSHVYRISVFADMSAMLMKWLCEEKGVRKINFVVTDMGFAHILAEAGINVLKGFPGGQVLKKIAIPMGELDMSPFVSALDKNADATIQWIAGQPGTIFVKTYFDFGLGKMPILRVDGAEFTWDQQLQKTPVVEGMTVIGPYAWTIDNPVNKRYVDAFKKKYGHFPDAHAGVLHDQIKIIHDVLQETKGDASPDKFYQTITKLNFNTGGGNVRFNDNRYAIRDYYIFELKKVSGVLQPVMIKLVKPK